MNTNARSLCPKINSLIDAFNETGAAITTITETWFRDCPELDADLLDIENGTGVSFICKNRKPAANGVAYGGVAIAF